MFSTWKSHLFPRNGSDDQVEVTPPSSGEEAHVAKLRKILNELHGSLAETATDIAMPVAQPVAEDGPLGYLRGESGIPLAAEPTTPQAASDTNLAEAQHFVAEQRRAAEELLAQVNALEERLSDEAAYAQTLGEMHEARERAERTRALYEKSKEHAEASGAHLRSLEPECENAKARADFARVEAEAALEEAADAERRLILARDRAAALSDTLREEEQRAAGLAANRHTAATEAQRADELLMQREAATVEARDAFLDVAARLEILQKKTEKYRSESTPAEAVQVLAMRMTQRPSPAQASTTPSEAADLLYRSHPNRKAAFIAGWRACAERTREPETARNILVRYTTQLYNLTSFHPNEHGIKCMQEALREVQDVRHNPLL